MDIASLEALIQHGESPTLEFKIAPPRPAEMAERICGFANSSLGGMIIIGVADKSWEIVGVKSVSDAVDNLLQAARLCKPTVVLIPAQPQVVDYQGKKLVIGHIPPNDGVLYQASGVYWLRRGTNTTPMETTELVRFLNQQGILSWEKQPVMEASLGDLEPDKIQGYIEQIATLTRRPARLTNHAELLVKLKCAVRVNHDPDNPIIYPTNAGLLLFGQAPRQFLNQAEVVATYYQDTSGVRRYTDRKILTGTIAEQIDQAEEFLRIWTPVGSYVKGFHRVDLPALPLEAMREAVVNALVHRDYSLEGTAVRIFYYPDRVEVRNPGTLLPGLTLEELQQGLAQSQPRNPVIASVLRDLPGGYMERVGSGVSFMINQMRELGLPAPQFNTRNEFSVTFYRNLEQNMLSPVAQSELPPVQVNVPPAIHQTIPNTFSESGSGVSTPLTQPERHQRALQFVRENGFITNKQYRSLNGTSENTAIRDLDVLVARGVLRKVGDGRNRRYML